MIYTSRYFLYLLGFYLLLGIVGLLFFRGTPSVSTWDIPEWDIPESLHGETDLPFSVCDDFGCIYYGGKGWMMEHPFYVRVESNEWREYEN